LKRRKKKIWKKIHPKEPSRASSPLACGHPKRPVLDYPIFSFLSCPFFDQSWKSKERKRDTFVCFSLWPCLSSLLLFLGAKLYPRLLPPAWSLVSAGVQLPPGNLRNSTQKFSQDYKLPYLHHQHGGSWGRTRTKLSMWSIEVSIIKSRIIYWHNPTSKWILQNKFIRRNITTGLPVFHLKFESLL
jgi:hypothetical protein